MADSTTVLKLVAMGAARPPKPQHRLDFNCLAIAARTMEAWHLYVAFRYDTAEEGGLPGICSIVLPEAEEEDALAILQSGMELGGYRLGQQLDRVDLTELLGTGTSRLSAVQNEGDPLRLARIVASAEVYDIRIRGNIIELRRS
jgi:hypothetical protein